MKNSVFKLMLLIMTIALFSACNPEVRKDATRLGQLQCSAMKLTDQLNPLRMEVDKLSADPFADVQKVNEIQKKMDPIIKELDSIRVEMERINTQVQKKFTSDEDKARFMEILTDEMKNCSGNK